MSIITYDDPAIEYDFPDVTYDGETSDVATLPCPYIPARPDQQQWFFDREPSEDSLRERAAPADAYSRAWSGFDALSARGGDQDSFHAKPGSQSQASLRRDSADLVLSREPAQDASSMKVLSSDDSIQRPQLGFDQSSRQGDNDITSGRPDECR